MKTLLRTAAALALALNACFAVASPDAVLEKATVSYRKVDGHEIVADVYRWVMFSYDGKSMASFPQPLAEGLFGLVKPFLHTGPSDTDAVGERVQFDTVIDGKALRTTPSGVPLYRRDTP